MTRRRTTPSRGIRVTTGLGIICGLTLAGCGDGPAAPIGHRDRLLIPGTELAAAVVVDMNARSVVRRIGPPLSAQGNTLVEPVTHALFVSGRLPNGDEIVIELDQRTGAERWRYVTAQGGAPVRSNGIALGRLAMALDGSRSRFYCWNSERGGVTGLAVFDYTRREAVDFLRIVLRRGGVAALPASSQYPDGAALVFGDDRNFEFSRAVIYVVAGTPLAIRDSIVLVPPSRRFGEVDVSPDGNELLVATNAEILRIEVATKRIVARSERPNTGRIARSPADGRLFLAAAGALDRPTSNLVHVLTPALELAAVTDLHLLPEADRPLDMAGSVVSADGRWLYVVSGVGRDGALYGPQPTQILILDANTLELRDIVKLRTYGVGVPRLTR